MRDEEIPGLRHINGSPAVDSRTIPTISPPAAELPGLRFASPSMAAEPEIAKAFNVNDRLKGAMLEYERGKALLAEVEEQQGEANRQFNEQRRVLATGLFRLEGTMQILREQGATNE